MTTEKLNLNVVSSLEHRMIHQSNRTIFPTSIHFTSSVGNESGVLKWVSNKLVFEGNIDESAQSFIDFIQPILQSHIESEVSKRMVSLKSPLPIKHGELAKIEKDFVDCDGKTHKAGMYAYDAHLQQWRFRE